MGGRPTDKTKEDGTNGTVRQHQPFLAQRAADTWRDRGQPAHVARATVVGSAHQRRVRRRRRSRDRGQARADVRIASQAIRNANDGISALAIGEKALGKDRRDLTRLSELASQSATGHGQRHAAQRHPGGVPALLSEIDRISNTTTLQRRAAAQRRHRPSRCRSASTAASNSQHLLHHGRRLASGIWLCRRRRGLDQRLGASRRSAPHLGDRDRGADARHARLRIESRLITAIANLRVAAENFSAAESRIRDADVAAETANLTRARDPPAGGVAVLAQANQQPRSRSRSCRLVDGRVDIRSPAGDRERSPAASSMRPW